MKKTVLGMLAFCALSTVAPLSHAELLASWDFERNELDSSGNGYDGQAWPSLISYEQHDDGSYYASFNGTTDYVPTMMNYSDEKLDALALNVNFNTTYIDENGAYDVENFDVWASYYSNWSLIDADRSDYYSLALDSLGSIWFSYTIIKDGSYTIYDAIVTDYTYNDGEWHQVSVSYGEVYGLTMYVDGELIYTSNYKGAIGTGSTTRYVVIGDGSESSEFDGARNNGYFEGGIDSARIYDEEISPDDVELMFSTSNIADVSNPSSGIGFIAMGLLVLGGTRKIKR
jgi:hypothetical protein